MKRAAGLLLALLLAAPAGAQTVPFGSLTPAQPGVVQTNDLRATSVTLSSALGSFVNIPVNGQNVVGLRFAGLAASGATITYYSSNDATQTASSPISSLNAALGQLAGTRATDGETRVPVAGRTTLRLQVTTAGTGPITVSYNVSAAGTIVDLGSPLPPGANQVGTVGLTGLLPAFATTPTFNLGALNGAATDASLQSILTRLGNPFQAGGSIANTAFGISGTLPAFAATPTFNIGTAPTLVVQATEADGANTTLGSKADVAAGTGTASLIAIEKQLHLDLLAATPAGTNLIGGVNLYVNGALNTSGNPAFVTGAPTVGAYYPAGSQPSYGTQQNTPLAADLHGRLRTVETGSDDPVAGVTPNGGTGSTCSTAAATTGCVAKNAQGNLYRAYATATTAPAAQQYLVCINATAVPATASAISAVDWAAFNLATTAGSTASINFGPGPPSAYAAGVVCLVSTSLTTYTAGTAAFVNTSVR